MNNNGFTLIEILAVIFIFLLVMGCIFSFFISMIKTQGLVLNSQELLTQIGYNLEYMSRALRLASQPNGLCTSSNSNYEITHSGQGIKFLNYLENDDCQEFFLEDNTLKQVKHIGTADETTFNLTSNRIEILNFQIITSGDILADQEQPKITIFLEAETTNIIQKKNIKVQTTLCQRNLDM